MTVCNFLMWEESTVNAVVSGNINSCEYNLVHYKIHFLQQALRDVNLHVRWSTKATNIDPPGTMYVDVTAKTDVLVPHSNYWKAQSKLISRTGRKIHVVFRILKDWTLVTDTRKIKKKMSSARYIKAYIKITTHIYKQDLWRS